MRVLLVFSIALLAVPLTTGLAAHGPSSTPAPSPSPSRAGSRQPPPLQRRQKQRVTVIGDSVADEISYVTEAQLLLRRGVRLHLQLAACRRLVEPSCTVAGVQPPTALELIHTLGHALGEVVAVSVGYNDNEHLFARDVRRVLAALRANGVQRVLWLNMRAVRHPYVAMNDTLARIARTDARLTVVDWNRYSRSHPSWFDSDGLHLTPGGAIGMARLLRSALGAAR